MYKDQLHHNICKERINARHKKKERKKESRTKERGGKETKKHYKEKNGNQ